MLLPEGETKDFLGQEFLTWLWYRGEIDKWALKFSEADRVSYAIDELLVLEPEDPTGCSDKLSGPIPVNSLEAQIGLQECKKIAAARFVLAYQEKEWTTTWDAVNFNFSSLKLKKPSTANTDDRFVELVEDLEQVTSLFERMYTVFLEIRLSEKWEKQELPAIREWIAKKRL